MQKRVLAMVLTVALLMSVIVFPANAATSSEEAALRQMITKTYKRLRASNGYDSYHGYCGKMAAYTLYYLGVDKKVHVHNGKDEYDAYKDLEVTTGGYMVETYPAAEYTLEEALNAISEGGTRDVYNILAGFQRTKTAAGKKYGHAVVIYGILNGNVYFTESFQHLGVAEGKPIVCSIKEFAKSYRDWTTFEGVIHFGTKRYADFCTSYPADLFVKTTEATPVYSIPSTVDVAGYNAKQLTTALSKERLEVVGLYQNDAGQWFYEVNYGEITGYVETGKAEVIRFNFQHTASGFNAPETLQKGKSFTVGGTVIAKQGGLTGLKLSIADNKGNELYGCQIQKDGAMASINKAASDMMKFSKLEMGIYTYTVTCELVNNYVQDGELFAETQTVTLVKKDFAVGNVELPVLQEQLPEAEILSGWQYDDASENWKYYEGGKLAQGWIFDNGADYYILEDGTAATGCVEINGEKRYFTPSGAMRTGWYETEKGAYYLLSNGAQAKGWHTVNGIACYFGDNGIWQPDAQYVPQENENVGLSTDELFTTLFESLNKCTEQYQNFFNP
ncbi:MAG: hypothetical protein E7461_07870 [Ruminococcaceae bacterium]|nr:hypothetical protein [Oscillospiraceae bacterium]